MACSVVYSGGKFRLAGTRRGLADGRDGLSHARLASLIIVGDRDEPFIAPSNYMARKIPGARLEVIKDAGHASNLDQPDAFNGVLRDFLDSLA